MKDMLEKAKKLAAQENFTGAVKVMDQLLKNNPEDIEALELTASYLDAGGCTYQADAVRDRATLIEQKNLENDDINFGSDVNLELFSAPQYRH